jgi:hypothetical protein
MPSHSERERDESREAARQADEHPHFVGCERSEPEPGGRRLFERRGCARVERPEANMIAILLQPKQPSEHALRASNQHDSTPLEPELDQPL